jgi:hypothetical protein
LRCAQISATLVSSNVQTYLRRTAADINRCCVFHAVFTVFVRVHRDAFNELTSQICGAIAVKAKEVSSRVNTPLGTLTYYNLPL